MSSKTKFLTIIIVALLLMNAGTLAFMFLRGEGNRKGPRQVSEWLARQLKLDEQQLEQFRKLQNEHRENMKPIHRQDHELHDRYFSLLRGEVTDSALVRQLADSIAFNRIQTELITFYDFQKIRTICKPEQQKKFDEIINQALRMLAPNGPPPPGKE